MIVEGRVRLRPFQERDLPLLQGWFDDSDVMHFWGMPNTPVVGQRFAEDLAGRFSRFEDAGYFAIDLNDGTTIGRVEFERLSSETRSAEVMILIGNRGAWGKGCGTDAMVALLRYLFHTRNLHRVSLTVLAWNGRAIRSYEKAGFTVEGLLRDDLYFEGVYHDQIVMSILRHEFDARWPAAESAAYDTASPAPVPSLGVRARDGAYT